MSINPILLQKTIRDNATDLHDFAKDLKNWGEEMKRKDEALKKENNSSSSKEIPKESKRIKKVKRSEKPKQTETKIGATDYAAWDKFDVDAELNKLDEDIPEDSDLTDECYEGMYDEAIVEKEKGNKFVKNQKWNEAIQCYTKAIECYSYEPIFYANRALCYLKLSKFEECENDCNLSIKLDDTYVKAYQRRAAARIQLNKLEHAEVDLKKVLILEPKNVEAKTELDKISIVLKRHQGEIPEQRPISKFTASRNKSNINSNIKPFTPIYQPPKETTQIPEKQIDDSTSFLQWAADPEIIEVKAIKKPPHLRSHKPLKRIEIKEISDIEIETKVKSPTIEEPLKKHVYEKTQQDSIVSTYKKESVDTKVKSATLEEPLKKHVYEKTQQDSIVSTFKKESVDTKVKSATLEEPLKKHVYEKTQQDSIISAYKKDSVIQQNNSFIEDSQEPPIQISRFQKQKSAKVVEEVQTSLPLPNPENKLQCLRTVDMKVIEKINPIPISKDVKNTVNDTKKLIENNDANTSFNYPKNSVQFYTSWKNFKTLEDKYRYLKLIEPQDLPRIFLNSLESNLFSGMLEVMVKYFIENKDNIYDFLNYLTEVKRFGAIVMFMSGEDKSNVLKLLYHIKENKEKEKEEVDRLIAKYEL